MFARKVRLDSWKFAMMSYKLVCLHSMQMNLTNIFGPDILDNNKIVQKKSGNFKQQHVIRRYNPTETKSKQTASNVQPSGPDHAKPGMLFTILHLLKYQDMGSDKLLESLEPPMIQIAAPWATSCYFSFPLVKHPILPDAASGYKQARVNRQAHKLHE